MMDVDQYSPDVEILVQHEDTRMLDTPTMEGARVVSLFRPDEPKTSDDFSSYLLGQEDRVLSVALAGPLHSGKSSVVRLFSELAESDDQRAGGFATLDSRVDECKRRIGLHTKIVSLPLASSKKGHFMINFVDTPGHLCFKSEVVSGIALADSLIYVLDGSTGVTPTCREILESVPASCSKVVLLVNKMDRLILELRVDAETFLRKLFAVVEDFNAILPPRFEKVDLLSESGSVVFGSACLGWLTGLRSALSSLYPELNVTELSLNSLSVSDLTRLLVEPIYKVFSLMVSCEESDLAEVAKKQLGLSLKPSDFKQSSKGKNSTRRSRREALRIVLSRLFSAGLVGVVDAFVQMSGGLKRCNAGEESLMGPSLHPNTSLHSDSSWPLDVECVLLVTLTGLAGTTVVPGEDGRLLHELEYTGRVVHGSVDSSCGRLVALHRGFDPTLDYPEILDVSGFSMNIGSCRVEPSGLVGVNCVLSVRSFSAVQCQSPFLLVKFSNRVLGSDGSIDLAEEEWSGILSKCKEVLDARTRDSSHLETTTSSHVLGIGIQGRLPDDQARLEQYIPLLPKVASGVSFNVCAGASNSYELYGTGELAIETAMLVLREYLIPGVTVSVTEPFCKLQETVSAESCRIGFGVLPNKVRFGFTARPLLSSELSAMSMDQTEYRERVKTYERKQLHQSTSPLDLAQCVRSVSSLPDTVDEFYKCLSMIGECSVEGTVDCYSQNIYSSFIESEFGIDKMTARRVLKVSRPATESPSGVLKTETPAGVLELSTSASGRDFQSGVCVLVNDLLPGLYDAPSVLECLTKIIDGFEQAMSSGPLVDGRVRNVLVSLVDVFVPFNLISSAHFKDSGSANPGESQLILSAVSPAVYRAIHSSILAAEPRLMEPVMRVHVETFPFVASCVSNLVRRRRGRVAKESRVEGNITSFITCDIPAMDYFGFEVDLRIASQGQAFPHCSLKGFDLVPGDPLDVDAPQYRLKSAPYRDIARDFLLKTRRRKGLPEQVAVHEGRLE